MNNNDKHISSRLLASAGALMMISGILMAICGKIAYGGVFWVSASCMFIASYNIRIAENKKESDDKDKD